jgi:hypothetical protein
MLDVSAKGRITLGRAQGIRIPPYIHFPHSLINMIAPDRLLTPPSAVTLFIIILPSPNNRLHPNAKLKINDHPEPK